MKPDLCDSVRQKQRSQMIDRTARSHEFGVGDSVLCKNFAQGVNWLEGMIAAQSGPVTYLVELIDGRIVRRHVNHVISCDKQCERPRINREVNVDVPDISQFVPPPIDLAMPQSPEIVSTGQPEPRACGTVVNQSLSPKSCDSPAVVRCSARNTKETAPASFPPDTCDSSAVVRRSAWSTKGIAPARFRKDLSVVCA